MVKFKVAVLVSLYKAGKFIAAKIDNLLQQTILDDCQIIFLNCQNLDQEWAVYDYLLQRPNFEAIHYDQHIQLYPTWNDGIHTTNSEYITNSNVDDMWHPEYLAKCARHLDRYPDAACVSSGIYITETPNQSNHHHWRTTGKYPLVAYPTSSAGPCPMWRRSLHDKYGLFGDYSVIGDARMWEKWYAGGESFHLIPEYLTLYYASSNSLERRHDQTTGVSLRDLDLQYDQAEADKHTRQIAAEEHPADNPIHDQNTQSATTDPAATNGSNP